MDRELKKIIAFFEHQNQELRDELQDLEKDIELQDELGLRGEENWGHYEDEEDEEDDESVSRSPVGNRRRSLSHQRKRSASHRAASMLVFPLAICVLPVSLVGQNTFTDRRRQSIASMEEETHNIVEGPTSRQRSISMSATLGKITTKLTNLKDSITSSTSHEPTIWNSRSDYAYDTRLLYKRRITNLYISFTNLRSYCEINYSGFRKIIKKYDKVTYSELKDRYLHDDVEHASPFTQTSKDNLNDAINLLIDLYAKCVSSGDRSLALQQLRLHQRENIAWERDTVWRQMIGRERRGEGDTLDSLGAVLANPPEPAFVSIPTPVGRVKITKRYVLRIVAVVLFVILLNTTVLEKQEANRCFAILTFCTFLWATEASSSIDLG